MSDSVQPHRWQPTRLPIPGILQARTLEWVAISFSNAWKWKVKVKSLSCVRLLATPWTAAYQAPLSMGYSRQEYWSGVPLPSPLARYKLVWNKGRHKNRMSWGKSQEWANEGRKYRQLSLEVGRWKGGNRSSCSEECFIGWIKIALKCE